MPSPLRRTWVTSPRLLPAVAILMAAAFTLPSHAVAQGSVGVRIESGIGSCPASNAGAPSGTPTSTAYIESFGNAECDLRGSAFTYLGVVGARASTAMHTNDQASGFYSAIASGTWSDVVFPTWPERFAVTGVSILRLHYNVSATGSVSASTGVGIGGGSAEIRYGFAFGPSSFFGSRFESTSIPFEQRGIWGTIAGSVDLPVIGGGPSSYQFPGQRFVLEGSATAGVGRTFGGGPGTASAEADFGSTLVWSGVVSAQAFDAAGNELALPADFRLLLRSGAQPDVDYWDPAVVVTATPEPATIVLVGAGVLTLAAIRRRRAPRGGA